MIRKNLFLFALLFLGATVSLSAQQDKSKRPSPPAVASAGIGSMKVVINYSQPGVKDRDIWGSLIPYGQIWRTGANEATTFEISEDALVNGQALPAGRYALFTIPGEAEWTFIFNKVPEQWGAYNYDEAQDALRVTVVPETAEFSERLTFRILEKEGETGGFVTLFWDELSAGFNLQRAN